MASFLSSWLERLLGPIEDRPCQPVPTVVQHQWPAAPTPNPTPAPPPLPSPASIPYPVHPFSCTSQLAQLPYHPLQPAPALPYNLEDYIKHLVKKKMKEAQIPLDESEHGSKRARHSSPSSPELLDGASEPALKRAKKKYKAEKTSGCANRKCEAPQGYNKQCVNHMCKEHCIKLRKKYVSVRGTTIPPGGSHYCPEHKIEW